MLTLFVFASIVVAVLVSVALLTRQPSIPGLWIFQAANLRPSLRWRLLIGGDFDADVIFGHASRSAPWKFSVAVAVRKRGIWLVVGDLEPTVPADA